MRSVEWGVLEYGGSYRIARAVGGAPFPPGRGSEAKAGRREKRAVTPALGNGRGSAGER